MKVLVTGGAGFIGSHLCEALHHEGYQVFALDNLSTGRQENLPPTLPLYQIDLRDQDALKDFFEKNSFDVIFHLAAQVDVRTSVDSPLTDAEINVLGTLNLISAASRQKPWIIFASTGGAIYGEKVSLPITEDACPQPEAPYGIAKLAGELYGSRLMKLYGGAWTTLRLANIYGPRQNPFGEAGVVAIFTYRMLQRSISHIYGDGLQTRDFVYVEDVVRAFLSVLKHPATTQGETYNVGTSQQTSVLALYQTIAEVVGFPHPPKHLPPKPGELRHNALSYQKLHQATNWSPQVSLSQGVRQTVTYFRQLQKS
jgi:UDP-glucose 4-epimerase